MPDCGGTCPFQHFPYEADINNGGTAQITNTDPTASACEIFLGKDSGHSGTLSVNHGTLNQCNDILVGWQGAGKLSITNGGFVHSFGTPSIASQTGSSGSVTVDGTNSQWTMSGSELDVAGTRTAAGGTGLLSVSNGGTVTAANVHVWKSGTLTGNGTVSMGSGSGTATVEGTVSRSSGTLTITGNLGLTPTALAQYSVTPQDPFNQADVSVSGTASLDGRLSVTMAGTFTPGTQFTLLQSQGALTGTFRNGVSITFPPGQGWSPEIIYDYVGNHVYLNLAATTGP